MSNKIKIQHVIPERKNGKLVLTPGLTTEESLEDLRSIMKNSADLFIDNLIKSTKGHTTTHGLIVHNLIHIIHDDEAMNDIEYQKFLKEELRIERKNKLNKINYE